MFFTLRLRIVTNKESRERLLAYEDVYHEQLYALIEQMQNLNNCKYTDMKFSSKIHPNAKWKLYRLAKKGYEASRDKRSFQYERSSTWYPPMCSYQNGNLLLKFQESFYKETMKLPLTIFDKEEKLLRKHQLIRMDVVHDEKFWFANFILMNKE